MTKIAYDAILAGLKYSFSSTDFGVSFLVTGYNDKSHIMVRRILETAKSLVIRSDRLNVMKEEVSCVLSLASRFGKSADLRIL